MTQFDVLWCGGGAWYFGGWWGWCGCGGLVWCGDGAWRGGLTVLAKVKISCGHWQTWFMHTTEQPQFGLRQPTWHCLSLSHGSR